MRHSKALMAVTIASVMLAAAIVSSCSRNPVNSSRSLSGVDPSGTSMSVAKVGGPPGYEQAYVNDGVVWINAIEVPQNPTDKAQADFYEVVYPFDPATGQELSEYWPSDPQCDPCDHEGNGITPDDFHDHVLDSRPSNPTGHEYNALWRVYLIMPNYTEDPDHNTAVNTMLKSLLPAKSEDAVNALLSTEVDGIPLAVKIDIHFYFICAVVGEGAATHINPTAQNN